MQRSTLTLIAGLLMLTLLSGIASAGADRNSNVRVYATWASGQVTDAAYSSDNQQEMGCAIYSGGVRCSASDALGNSLTCRTQGYSPGLSAAVASIGPASRIDFYTAIDSRECLTIYVRNDSQFL